MNKWWLIVCGVCGLLAVGAGLFFFVFAKTAPVVEASDDFLQLLGQGRVAEAYAATSTGFHAQQDEESFAFAVEQLGLTDFTSASWKKRSTNGDEGCVEGNITKKSGNISPATIRLVKEDGEWKIAGVRYGGVDLTAVTKFAPPQLPDAAELRRLARDTLLDFNIAVKAKDFTPFHAKLAGLWRRAVSAGDLQQTFQEFIDKQVDIGAIADLEPQFDPVPAIDGDGVLVLSGRYELPSGPLGFLLRYGHEVGGWRLIGINLHREAKP